MRFRKTLHITLDYEAHPNHYPKGASVQEMLDIDKDALDDDIYMLIDHPDAETETDVELLPK